MLENTRRNRTILAGVAGLTLTLALAATAGAVPGVHVDGGKVSAASVSQAEELTPGVARQPGDVAQAAPVEVPTTAAPTTTVKPRTTAPPTTKAPSTATTRATTPPEVAVPPAAAAPAAPTKVARRTPSPAEVQAAITELKRQVGGLVNLFPPTPAQIADAGDQVCTAFDNGQSFAQVKATGLSMIPASVTVSPATADWAVRQAVALYCPGHAPKLG